jgi:hypothetical protein
MNSYHDPELDDVLQDSELRRVASLLHAARAPEPPLDEAFRTGLRRQLMQEAWSMAEGRRGGWWRRLFAPPGIAWAGAVAGLLLIAAVAVWTANQQSGSFNQLVVASSLDNKSNVSLQQPILVSFNQPMDHQSTEAAVQITPATSVVYAWDAKSVQLTVTPIGGTLAPNTQYQVTIGSGAKTTGNQQLTAPQTITFVTQPPAASPTPTPSPRPTPANPLNEKQVAPLNGGQTFAGQWSADSQSVYYVDGKGGLQVVTVKTGAVTNIAPDGVTAVAVSPAGDRLAYIRAGKIDVLTLAAGKTTEITPASAPTLVAWSKDTLLWATAEGIYGVGGKVASLPTTGIVTATSISPDGTHAVYEQDANVFLLDLVTGKSIQLGTGKNPFAGWSPDGSMVLYTTADHLVVADLRGVTQSSLPLGEASWSTADAILLGGDTTVYEVRPDGSNLTHLANGTYRMPMWAPDGVIFTFVRGDALWVGTAPALPPGPTVVDEASAVVKTFMEARLAGKPDDAAALLDDSGKKAYGSGQLNLIITGEPAFTRYYTLTQEAVGTQPDTVRVVVRLVLTHGKKDVSELEERLTLVRDATTKQFLIDQASAGSQRELGKGPEVVSVDVSATAIQVTFNSDLDPATVSGGLVLLDSKGNPVDATVTYANKVVNLGGLDLKQGSDYRLVVETTVRDVEGQKVADEYDLEVLGPVVNKHAEHRSAVAGSPTPPASPRASPSPSPS